MTREEQIEKAEIKYFDETRFDGCDNVGEAAKTAAFIAGAKWADEHPKGGLVSLDKVCEWLDNNFMNLIWGATRSVYSGNFATVDEMIENFNNAMRK